MLRITVPGKPEGELWDEQKQEFVYIPEVKEQTLQLEHSLVSLSKWESKWCKSFLAHSKDLTDEEIIDYIRCMTITQNVNPSVYYNLSQGNVNAINEYINAPMTATILPKQHRQKNREVVTSELIYYWMISLNIPFECQKWHLNRLITLIQLCNVKNTPPKKTSRRALTSKYAAMNAANRARFNSKG